MEHYTSKPKSHFELCIDFEELHEDDKFKTAYPCPFCDEDFDLLDLCCHIDDLHSTQANTGICPLCVSSVETNLVEHISALHGNLLISEHKPGYHKHETYSTISISGKDLQDEDGYCQFFYGGSYPEISTSKTARDPWLSFLYSAAAADERENVQPYSSSEVRIEEVHSKESVLARDGQPSLFEKDKVGKAQRSEFVQGLLMSTILDPDF